MSSLCHLSGAICLIVALLRTVQADTHGPSCGGKYQPCNRKLFDDLLKDYEKALRPMMNMTYTLKVLFGVALIKIAELDEKAHTLRTHVWLRYTWTDFSLQWNPDDYDGIDTVYIPSSRIWNPDIVLYNSAHTSPVKHPYEANAVVKHDGGVLFIPQVHLESTCPLDLSNYPKDTQQCILKFGSWTYDGFKVDIDFFNDLDQVDINNYIEDIEWALVDHSARRNVKYYPCSSCIEPYPDLTFNLTLKRRPRSFDNLLLAPGAILALLVPTIFLLPPETGDKITLGTGLVFSQVLLMLTMIEFLPGPTHVAPRMACVYTFGLGLSAVALALAVLIRNIWNQSHRRRCMPTFVKTVILGILGRICCTKRDTFMPVIPLEPSQMTTMSSDDSTLNGADNSSEPPQSDTIHIINAGVQITSMSEWRQLAVILDRVFFTIFLAIVIVVAMMLAVM